jgi:ribosome recycling factor
MVNDVLKDLEGTFAKGIDAFKRELAKVRTGRANLALLDGVKVEYYGTMTPLNQVATLNVPDARLITIKPWEKSLIPMIEKAIKAQSELGLNPVSDGELVRLPIPPLTQERRKDLVRLVRHMSEEGKVALRNLRRAARHELEALEKDGDLSSDELKRAEKELDRVIHAHEADIDTALNAKEQELLED